MSEIAALVSSVIMLGGAVQLVWGVLQGRYLPSLGSRIVFLGIALIGLLAFVVDGNRDFVGAAVLITDIIATSIIAAAVVWKNGFAVSLHRFERLYLLAASCILVAWLLTDDAFLAFMLTQILIVLGYAPVIQKMFVFRRNTESLPAWIAFFASFVIGSYPAYRAWADQGEVLSLVYALRGAVCIGIIIAAGAYFEFRKRPSETPKLRE